MTFNRAIGIRRVNKRVETPYLRQILAALILLAICFFGLWYWAQDLNRRRASLAQV